MLTDNELFTCNKYYAPPHTHTHTHTSVLVDKSLNWQELEIDIYTELMNCEY